MLRTLKLIFIFFCHIIKGELKPIKEKLHSLQEAESNFSGVRDKRNKAMINRDNAREAIEELQEKLRDFSPAEKKKSDEEVERTRAKMVKEKNFKARDIEAKVSCVWRTKRSNSR